MKKCMIFAAGSFDADAVIGKTKNDLLAERKESFCIAADGGLDTARAIGISPDLLIGDMDSLQNKELPETLRAVKRLPREKDDTDTLAAVKEGLAAGCDFFLLYGALGGRIDHTLANIQCLDFLLNHKAYGVLYGTGQRMELVRNSKIRFSRELYRENRRLSVFAFGKNASDVTETGLKYTLSHAVVRSDFPMGVSNEFVKNEDAMVAVGNGTLLVCVED